MTKFDLYETVTARIIESIENGTLPWVKDWTAKNGQSDYNLITGKAYQGINTILLGMAGFTSPVWASYKQWQEKGCQVKNGSTGSMIVYASKIEKKEMVNGIEKDASFFMMKYHTIFNAEQVDGHNPETEAPKPFNAIEACEKTLSQWLDKITFGNASAFYSPSSDAIHMPSKEQFKTEKGFYNVAFHELAHLTGHATRLNRDFTGRFGSEAYAFEELVAEIASAFVSNANGIESIQNHDAYIANWLKVLKNDKKAIFTAAKLAQHAANMVQDRTLESKTE
jgi:antirestriction protein ArdC